MAFGAIALEHQLPVRLRGLLVPVPHHRRAFGDMNRDPQNGRWQVRVDRRIRVKHVVVLKIVPDFPARFTVTLIWPFVCGARCHGWLGSFATVQLQEPCV